MMNTCRLTVAQALLKFLSQQYIEVDGVEHRFVHGMFAIFGHGNVLGLGEALEFDAYGIKTWRGNNEQGMAHAAIAFAKQKQRLGIIPCTSSIGPGALNMVTAAGVATANRIPLLLLPGDVFADRQPDPVLQQIERAHDHSITANDAFKPLSKYWDRITRPEMLMTACMNAFRVLTDKAETGTVTLCLPQDVQCEAYDFPEYFFKKRVWPFEREKPGNSLLEKVSGLLKSAKNPMIIAGGGVRYAFAEKELAAFASRHGIAVCCTQAGKSALAWDHPFELGGIGTTGTMAANSLAQKADVILALGTRLGDFTTASKWQFPQAQLIQVNVNAMDSFKMDALSVKADVRETLSALTGKLGDFATSEAYQTEVKALKQQWESETECLFQSNNGNKLSQLEVLAVLNRHLTEEDTIICAAGSLPGDLHRLWQSKKSGDYHLEYGFSCMGYEVAAGLGVALAKETEASAGEAFVVVGDGSYLMMHSELVTALQEGKKMTIIVLDNSGFQCIHNLQTANGSEGFATLLNERDKQGLHRGKPLAIDFAAYAQSLGAKGITVDSKEALVEALQQARLESLPVLIDIKVEAKSMSSGYQSWWRVDVAESSSVPAVGKALAALKDKKELLKKY